METWKLFYDGGCNLCHTSQLRVERWALKAKQPLEVEVLQSAEAIEKGYGEMMVLEADDKVYQGADAWLRLLMIAPWYARWIWIFSLTPPTKWLASQAYWMVARVRYRIWGTRACPIPGKPSPPG